MHPCIVKQPIHDAKSQVWAYEILYSSSDQWMDKASDAEAASVMEVLLLQCSSDDFLNGRPAFVTFTQNLILRNVPAIFAPSSLVLQIDMDFLLSPPSLKMIERFRMDGYKVALVGFEFNAIYLSTMNMVDYVKLSFRGENSAAIQRSAVEVLQRLGKTVVAQHINTKESYEAAKSLGIEFMQGTYIGTALPQIVNRMDHLPGNFFQLMVAILKEEPEIADIEQIIARDVTLAYALLRLVNSAFFSLRSEVKSVHQALVILGVQQLKQWIYLLSFKRDGNVPVEFIKLSLLRASFCEALHSYVKGIEVSSSEAYLMGMFSTLGTLLQRPMEDILSELTISEEIKQVLLGTDTEGTCAMLYQIMLCYEEADWHHISHYAEILGIPLEVISEKYLECTDTISELWNKLSSEL